MKPQNNDEYKIINIDPALDYEESEVEVKQ